MPSAAQLRSIRRANKFRPKTATELALLAVTERAKLRQQVALSNWRIATCLEQANMPFPSEQRDDFIAAFYISRTRRLTQILLTVCLLQAVARRFEPLHDLAVGGTARRRQFKRLMKTLRSAS
ncbi:MAG: hypothetical protein JNJ61_25605 [Anaerolineae bacterium]|nr:hypothetical protein [Anaerolineae bacterium]